jgi:hypothetical protein
MKVHTTNYENTLIQVADDCPVNVSEVPPVKGKRSAANIQYDLISKHPYTYTSDDVLFQVYAEKNDLTEKEYKEEREKFFSKGQPCLRCSPLTKRYGWGVHSNKEGKIALFGCETAEYKKLSKDKSLTTVKAMKTSR